jgi:hypothetical protein
MQITTPNGGALLPNSTLTLSCCPTPLDMPE